jgi:AGZA family xanthine/uracil permease-like MFS transporter
MDLSWLRDILFAIFTLGDTIGEGFVAVGLGFAFKATGIGFLFGAASMLIFHSVVPVSFQVEGLTVVSRRNNGDWRGMLYTTMLAGVIGSILGFIGVYGSITSFIGDAIQAGMMVGAGLILCRVAFDLLIENWKIGISSAAAGYLVFIFVSSISPDWALVIALVGSVGIGMIAGRILGTYESVASKAEIEKVSLIPRSWASIKTYLTKPSVIRATLAILALRTGTSIAYGAVDSEILAGVQANPDVANISSGLASLFGGLFGGANLEPIISGTAAAPHPVFSGVLMMVMMGALCLSGVLPKLAKWVPTQAIVGFLLVLSTMIIIPTNISALAADPISGGVAAGITAAAIDPFLGMLVAIIVRVAIAI